MIFIVFMPFSPAAGEGSPILRFDGIYEPSGVVQLASGEVVIIEDEPNSPLLLMELWEDGGRPALRLKRVVGLRTPYDDLEGIAVGNTTSLFLMTSHSITGKGRVEQNRRKLLKIDLGDDDPQEQSTDRLFPALAARLTQLSDFVFDQSSINIEGISYDKEGEKLLIGLRSPVFDGRAIIVELSRPHETVAEDGVVVFSPVIHELAIDGGIRAITFDYRAGRYIVANERNNEKGKKRAALWSWRGEGEQPLPLTSPQIEKLKNIEGITVLHWQQKNFVLMVCDDGNRKKNRGASYLIIDYADLR